MTTLADFQYLALKRMKAGEEEIQPGELIPMATSRLFSRGKIQSLINTGWIAPSGLAPVEEPPKRKYTRRAKEAEGVVDVRQQPDDLDAGRDTAADG